jgi:glycosyltransferase involved in cell wall biosynthesis
VAVYTGRISHEKGVDVLLEAWTRWKKPPEATLLIVGDGPEAPRLKEKAGLDVRWSGATGDVGTCLQAADVLVLPSRGEALSNSLLEAMACALPCIATRVGGTPEVLGDGKRGILIPPEDPEALAKALNDIASDPDLRKRLGQAGRSAVEDRFSIKATAAFYINLYEELAASAPR